MEHTGSSKSSRYKDTTFHQLRSFYETGRLGSFSAAAQELKISNPTVWEQVHTLERYLGKQLVAPDAHGSRLTNSGQLLMEIVAPIIEQLNSLKNRFAEACEDQPASLSIGATPRIAAEDLPPGIVAFIDKYPAIRFRLREMHEHDLTLALTANDIDLAFAPRGEALHPNAPGSPITCFDFVPCYQVRPILVTPRGHPLAKRRRITAELLRRFPMIYSTAGLLPQLAAPPAPDEAVSKLPMPRPNIGTIFSATTRRYVKLGLGIGIISSSTRGAADDQDLYERDLTGLFGPLTIDVISRKGAPQSAAARLFVAVVQSTLSPAESAP